MPRRSNVANWVENLALSAAAGDRRPRRPDGGRRGARPRPPLLQSIRTPTVGPRVGACRRPAGARRPCRPGRDDGRKPFVDPLVEWPGLPASHARGAAPGRAGSEAWRPSLGGPACGPCLGAHPEGFAAPRPWTSVNAARARRGRAAPAGRLSRRGSPFGCPPPAITADRAPSAGCALRGVGPAIVILLCCVAIGGDVALANHRRLPVGGSFVVPRAGVAYFAIVDTLGAHRDR